MLILRLETICELSVSSSYGFMQKKSEFNPKFDSQYVKGLLTPPLWVPTCRAVGFQNPGFSVGFEYPDTFRFIP